MPFISQVYNHIRQGHRKSRPLYTVSLMIFFWAIFDGIIAFISPLVITEMGLSTAMMGIIIGSSSLAGAFFDFLLCRVLSNTNFRRIYLFMLALSCVLPLILWQAKTVWIYIIAMALWGLYYDFFHIATFDFVGRETKRGHSATFGVISVFSSLGYLLAPLLAGLVISEFVGFKTFLLAWTFLLIAIVFYFFLLLFTKKPARYDKQGQCRPLSFLKEFRLWRKIGSFILPVLLLTLILNINDAFFWTLGPLLSESLSALHGFGGLFMVAYTLPPLIVGWFVGGITMKFGQKRTAFAALLIGSLLLCSIFALKNPFLLIAVSFTASFFLACAWPSINGAYGDYIAETPELGKEIATLQDSFANIGYVVGPVLAGFIGGSVGYAPAFSVLGIIGALAALLLFYFTPRSINLKIARR